MPNVIQQIITDQISRLLDDYLYLDSTAYNLSGITKGNLQLTNIQIRPDVLAGLQLPFQLKSGSIGHLEIVIPYWPQTVFDTPVKVTVNEVYIVVGQMQEFDRDAYIRGARKAKREAINASDLREETFRKIARDEETKGKSAESWVNGLLESIIDNIQVTITHVHIRFEEDLDSDWRQHSAVGVTMRRLSLRTCDADWTPVSRYNVSRNDAMSAGGQKEPSRRMLSLEGVAAYWDRKPAENWELWNMDGRQASTQMAMQDMIETEEEVQVARAAGLEPKHEYLLSPTFITLKLAFGGNLLSTLSGRGGEVVQQPEIDAMLDAGNFDFHLTKEQYNDLIKFVKYLSLYEKYQKYSGNSDLRRPPGKEGVTEDNAKLWWMYAGRCVRMDLRAHSKHHLHKMTRQRHKRMRYIQLVKQMRGKPWRPPIHDAGMASFGDEVRRMQERAQPEELEGLFVPSLPTRRNLITSKVEARCERLLSLTRAARMDTDLARRAATNEAVVKLMAVGALELMLEAQAIEDEFSAEDLVKWRKVVEMQLLCEECLLLEEFGAEDFDVKRRLRPKLFKPGLLGGASATPTTGTSLSWLQRPPAAAPLGKLHVHVRNAAGLPKSDLVGKCDPYVQLFLSRADYVCRTSTRSRTLDPVWDERFEMRVERVEQVLHLVVFDGDTFSADDALGELMIPVASVVEFAGRYERCEWPLLLAPAPRKGGASESVAAGRLFISLKFEPMPGCEDALSAIHVRLPSMGYTQMTAELAAAAEMAATAEMAAAAEVDAAAATDELEASGDTVDEEAAPEIVSDGTASLADAPASDSARGEAARRNARHSRPESVLTSGPESVELQEMRSGRVAQTDFNSEASESVRSTHDGGRRTQPPLWQRERLLSPEMREDVRRLAAASRSFFYASRLSVQEVTVGLLSKLRAASAASAALVDIAKRIRSELSGNTPRGALFGGVPFNFKAKQRERVKYRAAARLHRTQIDVSFVPTDADRELISRAGGDRDARRRRQGSTKKDGNGERVLLINALVTELWAQLEARQLVLKGGRDATGEPLHLYFMGGVGDAAINGGGVRLRRAKADVDLEAGSTLEGEEANSKGKGKAKTGRRGSLPGLSRSSVDVSVAAEAAPNERALGAKRRDADGALSAYDHAVVSAAMARIPHLITKIEAIRAIQINQKKQEERQRERELRTQVQRTEQKLELKMGKAGFADNSYRAERTNTSSHAKLLPMIVQRHETDKISFEQHLLHMQRMLHMLSRYSQHTPAGKHPAASSAVRDKSMEARLMDTLQNGLLTIEFDLKDASHFSWTREQGGNRRRQNTDSKPNGRAAEAHRRPVAHAVIHLNSLEGLVHLPFVQRCVAFFVQPLEDYGLLASQGIAELPPSLKLLEFWDARLDLILQQLDVILMNHVLGPNMPLIRVRAIEGQATGIAQSGSEFQLDVQLPVEAQSYNILLQAYDCFLEPAMLGARLSASFKLFESGFARLVGNEEKKPPSVTLWTGSTPIHFIVTKDLSTAVISIIPTLDDPNADAQARGDSAGSTQPNGHAVASAQKSGRQHGNGGSVANFGVERVASNRLTAASTFLISPYWLQNETGVPIDATIDETHSQLRVPNQTTRALPISMMDASKGTKRLDSSSTWRSVHTGAASTADGDKLSAAEHAVHAQQPLVRKLTLSLSCELWGTALRSVRFDHVGCSVHKVRMPLPNDPFHVAVLACEVNTNEGGSNVLRLNSLLHVHNETRYELTLRLLDIDLEARTVESPFALKTWQTDVVVGAESRFAVPIVQSHLEHFSLKPQHTTPLRWSNALALRDLLANGGTTTCFRNADETGEGMHFSVSLQVEVRRGVDERHYESIRANKCRMTVVVSPPLRLCNLLASRMGYLLVDKTILMQQSGELNRDEEGHFHCFKDSAPIEVTLRLDTYQTVDPPVIAEHKVEHVNMRAGVRPSQHHFGIKRTRVAGLDSTVAARAVAIELVDEQGERMRLRLDHLNSSGGARRVIAYAEYWLLNKTQLPLRFSRSLSAPKSRGVRREGEPSPADASYCGSVGPSWRQSGGEADGQEALHDRQMLFADKKTSLLRDSYVADKLDKLKRNARTAERAMLTLLGKSNASLVTDDAADDRTSYVTVISDYRPTELSAAQEEALMASFSTAELLGDRIAVQVPGGRWSKDFMLRENSTTHLSILHPEKGVMHELAVSVLRAPGKFKRTSIVNVLPRFVLVNTSDTHLLVGQTRCSEWTLLPRRNSYDKNSEDKDLVWHWPRANRKRRLRLRVRDADGVDWLPSAAFPLGGSRDRFLVKSRHPFESHSVKVFTIHQEHNHGMTFVKVSVARPHEMPFLIENRTDSSILITQRDVTRTQHAQRMAHDAVFVLGTASNLLGGLVHPHPGQIIGVADDLAMISTRIREEIMRNRTVEEDMVDRSRRLVELANTLCKQTAKLLRCCQRARFGRRPAQEGGATAADGEGGKWAAGTVRVNAEVSPVKVTEEGWRVLVRLKAEGVEPANEVEARELREASEDAARTAADASAARHQFQERVAQGLHLTGEAVAEAAHLAHERVADAGDTVAEATVDVVADVPQKLHRARSAAAAAYYMAAANARDAQQVLTQASEEKLGKCRDKTAAAFERTATVGVAVGGACAAAVDAVEETLLGHDAPVAAPAAQGGQAATEMPATPVAASTVSAAQRSAAARAAGVSLNPSEKSVRFSEAVSEPTREVSRTPQDRLAQGRAARPSVVGAAAAPAGAAAVGAIAPGGDDSCRTTRAAGLDGAVSCYSGEGEGGNCAQCGAQCGGSSAADAALGHGVTPDRERGIAALARRVRSQAIELADRLNIAHREARPQQEVRDTVSFNLMHRSYMAASVAEPTVERGAARGAGRGTGPQRAVGTSPKWSRLLRDVRAISKLRSAQRRAYERVASIAEDSKESILKLSQELSSTSMHLAKQVAKLKVEISQSEALRTPPPSRLSASDVGVDEISPGEVLPYTWEYPWGRLRLVLEGEFVDGTDVWATSLSLRHPFLPRPLPKSDVRMTLSDMAGPMRLLRIEYNEPDLLPPPPNVASIRLWEARGDPIEQCKRLLLLGYAVLRNHAESWEQQARQKLRKARSDTAYLVGDRVREEQSDLLVQSERAFAAPPPPQLALALNVQLRKLGVSIIDGTPQELLHLELRDISVALRSGISAGANEALQPVLLCELDVGLIQLDNQLTSANFPVILAPRLQKGLLSTPIVQLRAQLNGAMVGVDYFEYVRLHVSPILVQLEEAIVRHVYALLESVDVFVLLETLDERSQPSTAAPRWEWALLMPQPQIGRARELVIDELSVSNIAIDLTLRSSVANVTRSKGATEFSLGLLFTFLGNVDNMPIILPSWQLLRHLSSWDAFAQLAITHYALVSSYLAVVFLLCANSLGGPLTAVIDVLLGLAQLVLYPVAVEAQGVGSSAHALRIAWAKMARLCVSVPAAFLNKLTAAWSRILTLITFDPKYINNHTKLVYNSTRVNNPLDGFAVGLTALFEGIFALKGIVTMPYVGAIDAGPRGFAKGLLQGALCVAKPFIGGLDFVCKVSEGVEAFTRKGSSSRVERSQPPAPVMADRLLRPFSQLDANAYALLSICSVDFAPVSVDAEDDATRSTVRPEFFIKYHPIDYMPRNTSRPLPGVVLVTTRRVVFGCLDPFEKIFEVPLERMARVDLQAPYTHILLWQWASFSRVFQFVGGGLPNMVIERRIPGIRTSQLQDAFDHLVQLAAQHKADGTASGSARGAARKARAADAGGQYSRLSQ